jgi:magnesium transporter
LIVRSLAIGDVKMGDWAKALAREVGIASALGLTLGLAVFGPAIFKGGSQVGVVVSLSAAVIVTLSSLIGMSLPFVLMKLKFDPAASSSPLITSVADILGVLIYFAFATWYLKI